eukprot:gene13852-33418_t
MPHAAALRDAGEGWRYFLFLNDGIRGPFPGPAAAPAGPARLGVRRRARGSVSRAALKALRDSGVAMTGMMWRPDGAPKRRREGDGVAAATGVWYGNRRH